LCLEHQQTPLLLQKHTGRKHWSKTCHCNSASPEQTQLKALQLKP
jgi:hypothetical protein